MVEDHGSCHPAQAEFPGQHTLSRKALKKLPAPIPGQGSYGAI